MKVTLYLKLEGFDDGDFDVNNDYYKSNQEFFDAMDRENKKYSGVTKDSLWYIENKRRGIATTFESPSKDSKNATYRSLSKNAKENNYKSEAILFDEKGNDETVDDLITTCVSQDVSVNIIKFNRDSMDEEFEEDYNFWIEEHENINNPKYKDALGEDKVFENEPIRTFYAEFLNNAGEKKFVRLENCKILDKGDEDEYAILSEKITLIDNI